MKRKSWLLQILDWIKPILTDDVIGWIYASNAIVIFVAYYFTRSPRELILGMFFLVIAIMFWVPKEWGE